MNIDLLNLDLLICIAEYLGAKDIVRLASCSRKLLPLGGVDSLWKRLCRTDHGITYNCPTQTYRRLYIQCTRHEFGRAACRHLSRYRLDDPWPEISAVKMDRWQHITCKFCHVSGMENIFVCVDHHCHAVVCDRHARLHSRQGSHDVFVKLNMAELFCQICVDWLGGLDADPAEQYFASSICQQWSKALYSTETARYINSLREIRRYERYLRWADTPQRMIKDEEGFRFVTADWIVQWELFIEGWRTAAPEQKIDHQPYRVKNGSIRLSVRFNPYSVDTTDVVIVSTKTWSYLIERYGIEGHAITEDDLVPSEAYQKWKDILQRWKNRAMAS
ncbi:uncharacterized protein BYT42DRAFT_644104 [Radiomyces spectabilis]|uniref:uncharacterized protein n=1 Tax=Radiomyces spectabilis TaxID=64574 RepID=UPI00221FEFB7|nr:uncharacterized protein BYT42DRAFT_644104 [Radiomyces spectabilis]KAI8381285.1 hypothetical protein BYT42DRAFT_644104 [Radiomyces spectabilis]